MKLYEIVNPHDKATFEAPDDEVATLAMVTLGEGRYGATDERGEDVCGIALFGGMPHNKGGVTLENLGARFEARKTEVAAALRSTMLVGFSDRAALKAAGGDVRKFNDAKRSSMTDMAGRAHRLADVLLGGGS